MGARHGRGCVQFNVPLAFIGCTPSLSSQLDGIHLADLLVCDLNGNAIDDMSVIRKLAEACPRLRILEIRGNPLVNRSAWTVCDAHSLLFIAVVRMVWDERGLSCAVFGSGCAGKPCVPVAAPIPFCGSACGCYSQSKRDQLLARLPYLQQLNGERVGLRAMADAMDKHGTPQQVHEFNARAFSDVLLAMAQQTAVVRHVFLLSSVPCTTVMQD